MTTEGEWGEFRELACVPHSWEYVPMSLPIRGHWSANSTTIDITGSVDIDARKCTKCDKFQHRLQWQGMMYWFTADRDPEG